MTIYFTELDKPALWHIDDGNGRSLCGEAARGDDTYALGTNGEMRYRVCKACRSVQLAHGEPMSTDEALAVLRRVVEEKRI